MAIVGVLGSGSEEHPSFAEPLGRWLAEAGHHLLTGGGQGVMTAVSRAFTANPGRKGRCLAVLPCADPDAPEKGAPGYPNPYIEIPLQTHLHLSGKHGTDARSRNHIIVLSADVLVALPGADGTSSEVHLAVRYGKPVIALGTNRESIPELPASVPWTDAIDGVQQFIRAHV